MERFDIKAIEQWVLDNIDGRLWLEDYVQRIFDGRIPGVNLDVYDKSSYQNGYDDGYENGWEVGYNEGYEQGCDEEG